MANPTQARQEIYNLFAREWEDTEFVFENEHFDPPANIPWAEIGVTHTSADHLGIAGNGKTQVSHHSGYVHLKIYTPAGKGMQESDRLTQTARKIFLNIGIPHATIRFNKVQSRAQGIQSSNWHLSLVKADFDYFEDLLAQDWLGDLLESESTWGGATFTLAASTWFGDSLNSVTALNNAVFSNASAQSFAGERLDAAVTLHDATFTNEDLTTWTGDRLDATVTVNNAAFTNSLPQNFAGERLDAAITLNDATLANSPPQSFGGDHLDATITLNNAIFANTAAQTFTGTVLLGTVTMNDATFANDAALTEWLDNNGDAWLDNNDEAWEY